MLGAPLLAKREHGCPFCCTGLNQGALVSESSQTSTGLHASKSCAKHSLNDPPSDLSAWSHGPALLTREVSWAKIKSFDHGRHEGMDLLVSFTESVFWGGAAPILSWDQDAARIQKL